MVTCSQLLQKKKLWEFQGKEAHTSWQVFSFLKKKIDEVQ